MDPYGGGLYQGRYGLGNYGVVTAFGLTISVPKIKLLAAGSEILSYYFKSIVEGRGGVVLSPTSFLLHLYCITTA